MYSYDPYLEKFVKRKKKSKRKKVLFITLVILLIIVVGHSFHKKEETENQSPLSKIQKSVIENNTTKQDKLVEFFERIGSPKPKEMAVAVLETKNPKLLAAVAVLESNANPMVKKTGYKNRHYGAFQVNPKFWGRVSADPLKQALQADNILDTLTKQKGDLTAALNHYGGCSRGLYAKNIYLVLKTIPI